MGQHHQCLGLSSPYPFLSFSYSCQPSTSPTLFRPKVTNLLLLLLLLLVPHSLPPIAFSSIVARPNIPSLTMAGHSNQTATRLVFCPQPKMSKLQLIQSLPMPLPLYHLPLNLCIALRESSLKNPPTLSTLTNRGSIGSGFTSIHFHTTRII